MCAVPGVLPDGSAALAALIRLRATASPAPARTAADRLLRSPRAGRRVASGPSESAYPGLAAAGVGTPRRGLTEAHVAWAEALGGRRVRRPRSAGWARWRSGRGSARTGC
ncbi:hypothetical protein GCM10020000_23690 [Streptomyces olivoverticillatus]